MTSVATQEPDTICRRLQTIQRGAFDADASAATRDLVRELSRAVEQGVSKPKGRLTLVIDFTLDRGVIDVVADFAVKLPKKVRGRSLMYPGKSGELLDSDPSQMSLGLTERTPARDVTEPDAARGLRAV